MNWTIRRCLRLPLRASLLQYSGSYLALFLCIVGLSLSACTPSSSPPARPVVVVSVPPQAYFVHRLVGDLATIETMIPPGATPATYEPTVAQVEAVQHAVLYVKVGHPHFPFEHIWLARLLHDAEHLATVDFSKDVQMLDGDPHVWLSPTIVRATVPRLADALAIQFPDHAQAIRQRAKVILNDIAQLDTEIRTHLSTLQTRRFYTVHDAWGYFARDYRLEQVALEHGAKEPDPHALAQLIVQARQHEVRTIFTQPQFSDRSAKFIAREINGRTVVIDPLAYDWVANMRRVADTFRTELAP